MFALLYIMESSIAATQDELLSSLSFKLPSTADYIQSRDEVTFFRQMVIYLAQLG